MDSLFIGSYKTINHYDYMLVYDGKLSIANIWIFSISKILIDNDKFTVVGKKRLWQLIFT